MSHIHTRSHNWLINVFDKMQPNNSTEKRLKLLPTIWIVSTVYYIYTIVQSHPVDSLLVNLSCVSHDRGARGYPTLSNEFMQTRVAAFSESAVCLVSSMSQAISWSLSVRATGDFRPNDCIRRPNVCERKPNNVDRRTQRSQTELQTQTERSRTSVRERDRSQTERFARIERSVLQLNTANAALADRICIRRPKVCVSRPNDSRTQCL